MTKKFDAAGTQAFLQELEKKAIARLRAQGVQVNERPPCYREAKFDELGYLVPDTEEELRAGAIAHRQYRDGEYALAVEKHLQPTTAWPRGRETVIAVRLQIATASEPVASRLLAEAAARGVAWPTASDADFLKLPLPLLFNLLSLGLMKADASSVTQEALAVFSPFALASLLSLDAPLGKRRPRSTEHGRKELRELRAFESLLPVLTQYGQEVIDLDDLRRVLRLLQKLLNARASIALAKAQQERDERRRRQSLIAMTEGGWTMAGVGHRRQRLTRLISGLHTADRAQWTFGRIVDLILASESDWARSPCPEFVAKYRDRRDELLDLVKKDYKRATTGSRKRAQNAVGRAPTGSRDDGGRAHAPRNRSHPPRPHTPAGAHTA